MESSKYNNDFEQFVKQNADQYRMFPSEKVWNNIHSALHTRRKWYGAGLVFLLLLTGSAVTLVMVTNPGSSSKKGNTSPGNIAMVKEPASSPVETSKKAAKNFLPFSDQLLGFDQTAVTTNKNTPLEINDVPGVLTNNTIASLNTEVFSMEEYQQMNMAESKSENTFSDMSLFADDVFIDHSQNNEPASGNANSVTQTNNEYLSIESVVNTYQPKNGGRKLSWQFFVTPTISYRKLSVNKSADNVPGFPYAGMGDVNNAVTHKPDLGLQIGLSAGYPITKNLKLRSGLQFNINRYDIKAYTYNPEYAMISLDNANGVVSAWTNYRNYGGYKTNWLKNFYFSVSAPIGAELTLLGNKKTNWGVAGTIQPTYIIKDKAYLISTDYKNYAKVPSLVRRVNVSASFETFVTLGENTRWQIGPQVRYQILSSFQNQYPVKEHLFDFGLKLGVFLNE